MEKVVKLKNGEEVIIRPLNEDDAERSLAFFQALPTTDRIYLRRNIRNLEVAKERIREMESDRIKRLVALRDKKIIADGSLERESHDWKSHICELRLIVDPEFRRVGLGVLMVRELYLLAAEDKVEEIVVKIMHPQVAALKILKQFGFREEGILHDYVKDLKGKKQNLVIMRCDLSSFWDELENYFTGSDWEHMR